MKKLLFAAVAAAGMLSACTSNENVEPNAGGNTPRITLGVSNNTVSTTTRGTGTVGDIEAGKNVWAGQYLWVSMLDKGTLTPSEYTDNNAGTSIGQVIFDNKLFVAPKAADNQSTGEATADDGSIAYYPVKGNSDFWGYRVDDAANADPKTAPTVKLCDSQNNEVSADAATRRVVDITIDGSQDIMVGKATLGDGDADKLGAGHADDYYSAYAARHGVNPNINFNHLLTRFTFNVKAGNKSATGDGQNVEAIKVTKVVLKSKNKGQLVVANTENLTENQLLTFADDVAEMELMQRNSDDTNSKLVNLSPVTLTWNGDEATGKADTLKVGESLLVAPGETEYAMEITFTQDVKTSTTGTKQTKTIVMPATIKLADNATFAQGTSYNVTVTIYGLEHIVVNATLVPWNDGGNISIDDDQQ